MFRNMRINVDDVIKASSHFNMRDAHDSLYQMCAIAVNSVKL